MAGRVIAALVGAMVLGLPHAGWAAGELDPTFGSDGGVGTTIGEFAFPGALAVAVQPDGRIVAAGAAYIDDGTMITADLALVRYLPDGSRSPPPDGPLTGCRSEPPGPRAVAERRREQTSAQRPVAIDTRTAAPPRGWSPVNKSHARASATGYPLGR